MPFVHVAWSVGAAPVADFASVRASATYTADGSSFPVTLPTGYQGGDLLLALINNRFEDGTISLSTPTGWTALYTGHYGTGSAVQVAGYYRVATGSEGSTVTIAASASTRVAALTYAITGWDASGATADALAVSAAVTGTSQAPDPASLTPAWGSAKTLWLAVAHSSAGSGIAYPTSYASGISAYTGNSTTWHARCSAAERDLEAASEDAGAFSLAPSSSQPWHARAIAVRPA